jgi:hypothetical protein
MKKQKIRGHRRRWKSIKSWIDRNKPLDLDLLKHPRRRYAKIRLRPWSDLTTVNSEIPQPFGKTKKLLCQGLIEIHGAWKAQLEKLGEPYYLRIWLFDPQFSESQVVCALGSDLHFYDNTFSIPPQSQDLDLSHWGEWAEALEAFQWEHKIDEEIYTNDEVGPVSLYEDRAAYEQHKAWFRKKLLQKHRVEALREPVGEATEAYIFKRGDVWIGK